MDVGAVFMMKRMRWVKRTKWIWGGMEQLIYNDGVGARKKLAPESLGNKPTHLLIKRIHCTGCGTTGSEGSEITVST